MANSEDRASFNPARRGQPSWGPQDTKPYSTATVANTEGQATASGHGQHPRDMATDESQITMPGSKLGPPNEDLEGEKVDVPVGEGRVMHEQLDKTGAGWGEQESLTGNLDRQKTEQKGAREAIKGERKEGGNVDGAANMVDNEAWTQQ